MDSSTTSPLTPLVSIFSTFGEIVRAKREQAGLSQEQFGERADLDRTYVSGVERGVRNPTLQVINRIAKALDVPLADLFAATDKAAARRKGK